MTGGRALFERDIKNIVRMIDGTQEIHLACGHTIYQISPIRPEDQRNAMNCAQCVRTFLAQRKRRQK